MKLKFTSFIAAALILNACDQAPDLTDGEKSVYSNIPEIISVDILSDTVQIGENLDMIVQYRDGNGDLGFSSGDSLSLFITDNRFPLTIPYYVPELAPQSALPIIIQGHLEVSLNGLILKDQANSIEEAEFIVQIKDREQNYSNEFVTSSVFIQK